MRAKRKDGYSLVEVSLALLVAAIGLMTIFALFPDGLSSSRKSVDATEIAAFADYVYASLDEMASFTNAGSWSAFRNDGNNLPPTHMFDGISGSSPTQPRIEPGGSGNPHVYYWTPGFHEGDDELGVTKYQVATFTYTLDIGQAGLMSKYARLEVWPGDIKQQVEDGEQLEAGTVFYREYLPLE